MRIIYVTSTLPTGPSETFIYPEVQELVRRGEEVLVVPLRPRGGIVHQQGKLMLPIARVEGLLGVRVLFGAVVAVASSPRRAFSALRLLLTRNPRHLAKNLAAFPKALWLGRTARRWGADHIHAHWVATTASMAMAASEYSSVPWSFTAHRWDILENNLIGRKLAHAQFGRFIAEKGLQAARANGGIAVPDAKAFVLHMGVPIESHVSEAIKRGKADRFRLLCAANLIPRKGHEFLLEAVAELNGVQGLELWLAGDGELRRQLEERVGDLGLQERVRFLGRVDHDQLLDFYRHREVDAVVLASIELGDGIHEGVPVSLIEAMSFGIPVIATASGGTAELLDDRSGLLVPACDSHALAGAIRTLFENHELYAELGRRGRERVNQGFEIRAVVDGLVRRMAATACPGPR